MPSRPLHARPHTLYLLSSIRRFRRHNPFTIPLRTVPIPVLCLISKGTGVVHINDMMHRIEPLQWLFLNHGMTIEATFHSKDIEYFMIIMNPITITRRKSEWQAARNSGVPRCLLVSYLSVMADKYLNASSSCMIQVSPRIVQAKRSSSSICNFRSCSVSSCAIRTVSSVRRLCIVESITASTI